MTKKYLYLIVCILFLSGCSGFGPQQISNEPLMEINEHEINISEECENANNTVDEVILDNTDSNESTIAKPTIEQTNTSNNEEIQNIMIDEAISTLQVHYIDVDQGDCTLIICNGEAMIIDAGNNDKGTLVQSYISKQGIKKLKYVIGTHPDADHIGGLDVVLYKFDCENIIMPDVTSDTATYRDVIDVIKNKYYKITYPFVGDEYVLGDATFTILSPDKNYDDKNNCSVVILLKHGNNKFIFMGDAENVVESNIINSQIDVSSDVIKVGHHGSHSSSTDTFINKVNPKYAVISCGTDNSYGHPHAETLNTLRKYNIETFRTDEQGTIIATSDGNNIIWNTASSDSWIPGEPSARDVDTIEEGNVNKDDIIETINQAYILNTNTKKIHKPECESVADIKNKNKEESNLSKEELIKNGYSPCKRCNP